MPERLTERFAKPWSCYRDPWVRIPHLPPMKYLGIDFGAKRVGLAVSDDTGRMAFPYLVIQNENTLLDQILTILEKEKIDEIVIGESKNFEGEKNKIMKEIEEFVAALKTKISLPIFLEPEFMTSVQAEHLQGKNEMSDASAATLILQYYLDRLQ